jgi:hypothetical protein
MDAKFMHKSPIRDAPSAERIGDGDTSCLAKSWATADHACCCPGKAAVRVTIPPSPSRRHTTELLLCGHHYRVSMQALTAARAVVRELPGTPRVSSWIHVSGD